MKTRITHSVRILCRLWLGVCLLAEAKSQTPVGLRIGLNVGQPQITLTGAVNTACQVQWTDRLSSTVRWFHLAHCLLSNSPSLLPATSASGSARYFRAVRTPNTNTVWVSLGTFAMGDTFSEGSSNERPVHNVNVSGFYMEKYEVTKALWDDTYNWAVLHGYTFDNPGSGRAANHPVHSVNWFDVVKWCNARSEKEGLTPAYYTSAEQTNIYRTGQLALVNGSVNWNAGYRLPTEAEWEKAARGGAAGLRYPWGNAISFSQANYADNPSFASGPEPHTSPVGYFVMNGYGLHDVIGNVWEWCWDWHDNSWYSRADATQTDTRGPSVPTGERAVRGGAWYTCPGGIGCFRCASRAGDTPYDSYYGIGFRCVRMP